MNILPEDTPEAAALRDELREKRGNAHLEVGRFHPSQALAGERGFEVPPEWTAVSAEEGFGSLVRLLAREPGDGAPTLSGDDVRALAGRIRGLFSERARFFTSGERDRESSSRVTASNGDAPLDSSVLVVDGDRAGLLWVEGEE